MKIIKIIITTILVFSFNIYSQDFTGISRNEIKNSQIPIPTPSKGIVDDLIGAVGGRVEDGANVIRDLVIKNPVREITVMVFMNSKNNLEAAGLYNLNDMERIGSTDKVNIIVEAGRMRGQQGDISDDGDWIGVRRYYIKKDNNPNKVTSRVIYSKSGKNVYDMGDYKKVVEFVKWTKEKFPAKRYILILWNHGTGWLDPVKNTERNPNKGISFDDETGNYITTEEIGKIVKEVGGVDILAFDACLMQMVEVLYEVKDHTKVIVGSEEVVPGYGYPYALFLDLITKNPSLSNENIAKGIVDAFVAFYNYVKQPATLSAIRSNKIAGLKKHMSEFAKAAMEADEIEALKKARQKIIRFDVLGEETDPNKTISFFGDIYHFADIVSKNIKGNDEKSMVLKTKAEMLKEFITKELVIARGSFGNEITGKPLELAYGVSAYFPPVNANITPQRIDSLLKAPYNYFKFSKESGWGNFVKFLYEKAK